jgi:hypothetical protein
MLIRIEFHVRCGKQAEVKHRRRAFPPGGYSASAMITSSKSRKLYAQRWRAEIGEETGCVGLAAAQWTYVPTCSERKTLRSRQLGSAKKVAGSGIRNRGAPKDSDSLNHSSCPALQDLQSPRILGSRNGAKQRQLRGRKDSPASARPAIRTPEVRTPRGTCRRGLEADLLYQ